MTRIRDIGERGLLAAIAARLAGAAPKVVVGVGDDAAILEAVGPWAVLSSDMLVEGVDFEFAWASPADVGRKAAAVNLSDLAAMGAQPRACLLSLALRSDDRARDVLRLVTALDKEGRRFGAPLVGGDLSATRGPLVLSVTVIGEVEKGCSMRRGRGRIGDVVLVSGRVGGAAAGLRLLQQGKRRPAALVKRQLRPEPRVALGRALSRSRLVKSCADVSDGLQQDAQHLAPAGARVRLDPERVPIDAGVAAVARSLGLAPTELALGGGEDFELVIAVAPKDVRSVQAVARRQGVALTAVGEIVRSPRRRPALAAPGGFDHFAQS